MAELQQQRKALDTEMEFYQRDPAKAPMVLRRKIAENEDGMAEQQRFVANQDLEKRRIHQRFDAELAQLRRLWATQMAPAAPASEVLLPAAALAPALAPLFFPSTLIPSTRKALPCPIAITWKF